jgi:hypothetical protein
VSPVRRGWLSIALFAAVAALAVSVVLAVGQARTPRLAGTTGMMGSTGAVSGPGMMGGTGMMGGAGMTMGTVWLPGNGVRAASIPAARDRAATAAKSVGLHPGEAIWFDNGFYVKLQDAAGDPATEVIVNPGDGAVSTEPGPAMMWNTRYGMRGLAGASGAAAVSATQAQQLATAWMATNLPGRLAQPPDAYPGYYTLETTTGGGTVNGMLSVNAGTGQVWYHSWHGRFIAKDDS